MKKVEKNNMNTAFGTKQYNNENYTICCLIIAISNDL